MSQSHQQKDYMYQIVKNNLKKKGMIKFQKIKRNEGVRKDKIDKQNKQILQIENNLDIKRTMSSKTSNTTANYKLNQMFGYKGPGQKVQEQDIISKISFDKTGKYLALGDHAGRIIIFELQQNSQKKPETLEYYAQFQSHSKQFDPLKSEQVSETINGMQWLTGQGKYQKLITTNERNIKVWKLFEKCFKKVGKPAGKQMNIPKLEQVQNALEAVNQTTFPSKHMTAINTISTSCNEQYLLSTDDVHGYLWSMEKPSKPYIVADYIKGKNLQDIKENLTCNTYHPTSDSLFLLATDKGSLKMADLRKSSNFGDAMDFVSEKVAQKNFFTQLISSYSSAQFIKKGKYIAARDYLNVKIWDICNVSKPLMTISLQESLKSKLCDLFENDSIYDKFSLSASEDGTQILTGNYNNSFHMVSALTGQNNQYELSYKKSTIVRTMSGSKPVAISKLDNVRKTTALTFHPTKKMAAVASLNCFFIYSI